MQDYLPGYSGKLVARGPIRSTINVTAPTANPPTTWWSFDDIALTTVLNGTQKNYRLDMAGLTSSDVTGTLTKKPFSSVHARFGDFVFGAIQDANQPALGRWDGGTTNVVIQTNAPFKFTDVKTFAHRLFVLGGTVPGAGGATAVKTRTLYCSDADAADLSVLTAWQDDVSGLVNQLTYDTDDTPVGLALCGRFLAILGTRTINVLTGDGMSNFAFRNVTKEYGCLSRESIVETTTGFYFMSDRGYAFCDGTGVRIVGGNLSRDHLNNAAYWRAAMQSNGYLTLDTGQSVWLYMLHLDTGAWTTFYPAGGTINAAYGGWRTVNYPVAWKNGYALRTEVVARPGISGTNEGLDNDGVGNGIVAPYVNYRQPRLAGPGSMLQVQRVLTDISFRTNTTGAGQYLLRLVDWSGAPVQTFTFTAKTGVGRQRDVAEPFLDVDSIGVQVLVDSSANLPTRVERCELYDVYIEYEPGRPRPPVVS